MDFPDMITDVKEEAKRRLASPFFGAYVLSWCAFNYQVLIVLLSQGEYEKKIGYITKSLYAHAEWPSVFGWPALAALAYVMVSPMVTVALDLWAKWVRIQGDNLLMWAETKRWGSDEELRTLVRHRGFELDNLRRRAADGIILVGELRYQMLSSAHIDADVERRKLPGLGKLARDLTASLIEVIEQLGMPVDAYSMLKLLTEHGFRTEEQLLRDGRSSQDAGQSHRALSFLLGAKLVELNWKDGPAPGYVATTHGRQLSHLMADHYSQNFV